MEEQGTLSSGSMNKELITVNDRFVLVEHIYAGAKLFGKFRGTNPFFSKISS
jgi:hypothetical protein